VLGDEDVVPRRVVGDPVEDDVQAEVVGGVDEVAQVVDRANSGLTA